MNDQCMNTSANTNQIHHTTTSSARATGIGFLRRSLAGALLASAITATAIGLAATSHADFGDPPPDFGSSARPEAHCKTEPFGFLGSQRRTLCDGPISRDGSWSRERTIWVPAHRVPETCTSGGAHDSFSFCYGGNWVDQRLVSNETYPVRPETVLPDEPGHVD
jgi:hypothetical protein